MHSNNYLQCLKIYCISQHAREIGRFFRDVFKILECSSSMLNTTFLHFSFEK